MAALTGKVAIVNCAGGATTGASQRLRVGEEALGGGAHVRLVHGMPKIGARL